MDSLGTRTQQEIADYIKLHSSNGKLTKSLMDIGKEVGYSNATIHRGLQALEEKGLIEVTPSEKRTEPNTIFYKGTKNEIDVFLSQGVQLQEELLKFSERLNQFMENGRSLSKSLEKTGPRERAENPGIDTDATLDSVDD